MSKGMSKVKRIHELKEKYKNVSKEDIITLYAEFQIESQVEYWAMVHKYEHKIENLKLEIEDLKEEI
tara:strand:+ start:315 stop:515 length:201 start_codon:yes stop_codon:yes gene_type:complete